MKWVFMKHNNLSGKLYTFTLLTSFGEVKTNLYNVLGTQLCNTNRGLKWNSLKRIVRKKEFPFRFRKKAICSVLKMHLHSIKSNGLRNEYYFTHIKQLWFKNLYLKSE